MDPEAIRETLLWTYMAWTILLGLSLAWDVHRARRTRRIVRTYTFRQAVKAAVERRAQIRPVHADPRGGWYYLHARTGEWRNTLTTKPDPETIDWLTRRWIPFDAIEVRWLVRKK